MSTAVGPNSRNGLADEIEWLIDKRSGDAVFRGTGYSIAKRVMDLVIVGLSLPLLIPVFLLCAAAIRLESPGAPALFVQERTGRGGGCNDPKQRS